MSDLYKLVRSAIRSRNNEEVDRLYNVIVDSDSGKALEIDDIEKAWIEILCLMYTAYVGEDNRPYKKCLKKIGLALGLINEEDWLIRAPFIYARVRCADELFHLGEIPDIGLTKDRMDLFDYIVRLLAVSGDREGIELNNMMDVFISSAIVDLLNNAKDNAVYGFLISQVIFVEQWWANIALDTDDKNGILVISQCLYSRFTTLVDRLEDDFEPFSSRAKQYEIAAKDWNPRNQGGSDDDLDWDAVTLGFRLPEWNNQ